MTSPASDLLYLWERAVVERPAMRPIALLADGDAKELPLGRRNARLFLLRERVFGSRVACLAGCPHCDERVEFEFQAADVLSTADPPTELMGSCDGYELRFRPPTAGDLAALGDGANLPRQLFQRCLVEVHRGGRPVAADELPENVIGVIAARMAQADANADIRLDLVCPACQGAWRAPFDIAAFFWAELDYWARRLLDEVHLLASAYGWRESDILELSPIRRRYYLERITR